MKQPKVEFSRPLQVDRVPNLGSNDRLEADPKECVELAKRLGLPVLHALKGFLHSKPWRGGGLKITGTLTASFDQQSVVSLETFRTELKTEVERYFIPSRGKPDEEVNDDIDYIEDGMVDLGEIMTETLALELDPYPRKPGEVFQDIQEDVEAEKITPFAALSKLKPASSDEKK